MTASKAILASGPDDIAQIEAKDHSSIVTDECAGASPIPQKPWPVSLILAGESRKIFGNASTYYQ